MGITRRGVLVGGALLGVGAGVDRALGGLGGNSDSEGGAVQAASVDFYGAHQAGIGTPAQEYLNFASFDVTAPAASDLQELLRVWSGAAAKLTAGRDISEGGPGVASGPADTGEADGLGPASLTLTFGFGPGLFAANRFGLERQRPLGLKPLPAFQGEFLDPARSDGDICIQACAENPQVAFHAIHVLTRLAHPWATLRWQQLGFGRTSSTSDSQPTPRNLMGFKDGTNNIRGEDQEAMDRFVWVQDEQPSWMRGGTYLIARRIRMLFDVWDPTSLEEQEATIGRKKESGAPLGGKTEREPVDLTVEVDGRPAIPADAHIRLASPDRNAGQRILRRGYSYAEPTEPGSGQIDAGLFFIAFQRDPWAQFVPLQKRLARSDALNRHTQHTTSALFACPPGTSRGEFLGEGLFA
ncbi:MAG TPA: iron uptake transporter deferrochelatase/peroxidase subunit [Solirubrobacterales bacterium]|nr:iron uptake transporter deferrochelatase/peroxidase subunit [Solirubrobacterales bacterium]